MRFGLLGDLLVEDDAGAVLPLHSPHGRALLATLLLTPNRPVSRERLTDALWGAHPPPSAAASLINHVTRLRRLLGPDGTDRLRTVPAGYQLRIGPAELDTDELARAMADATEARRAEDWRNVSSAARTALDLWRGTPLADLPQLADQELPAVRSFEEARLQAAEWYFEAELQLGRHEPALVELTRWAAQHPLHEALHVHLITALYRSGRQAEALTTFDTVRTHLAEELGIDPGPALRTVHQQVLRADPDLRTPPPPTPASAPTAPAAAPAPPPPPAQLPADAVDFTGRSEALTTLTTRLEAASSGNGTRVLALSGMGGVGKTALAVHSAHRVRNLFPDGQLYVDLHGFGHAEPRAPREVVARLVGGLDPEQSGTPLPDHTADRSAHLRSALTGRRVLLLLDNARDAAQVLPLLPGDGRCAVLVTSRIPLADLPGAVQIHLEPLDVDEQRDLLARVCGPARVAAEPDDALRLLAACGGLPLALRVTSARLAARPTWPLGVLADLLTHDGTRLRSLTAGHLSVRTTLASSYLALRDGDDPVERDAARLFRLLGLWPGLDFGIKHAAALAACPERVAAELLETLVDFQLLQSPEPLRYRFHDLLGEYAAEIAGAEESLADREAARVRLMVWYCAALEQARNTVFHSMRNLPTLVDQPASTPPDFTDGPQVRTWCTQELGNITTVVREATTSSRPDLAWRIACNLSGYMTVGWWTDAADECRQLALRTAERHDDLYGQALMLQRIGLLHGMADRYPEASEALTDALARAERSGQNDITVTVLRNLATLHMGMNDCATGLAYAQRVVEHGVPEDDDHLRTLRASAHLQLGDYASAEVELRRSVETWRRRGSLYNTAVALTNLADSLRGLNRRDEALTTIDEARRTYEQIGDPIGTTDCLLVRGQIHLHFGDWNDSADILQAVVDVAHELRLPSYVQQGLESLDQLHRLRPALG
ncbi:AfsR/SARP family transcriptional regulator [Kitasatospora sp. NPDC096147]|uniref:AfsR/SARP family transcriptional regulator n=1 Tax=Kitasatospora sp. NPDC096147 TaxID=3364093 RepID=UPI00381BA8F4